MMGKSNIVCMFESNLHPYTFRFRLVQTRRVHNITSRLVRPTVVDVVTFSILNAFWTGVRTADPSSLFLKKSFIRTRQHITVSLLVLDESFLHKRLDLLDEMTPINYIVGIGLTDDKEFQTRPVLPSWLEKRLVFLHVLCSPGLPCHRSLSNSWQREQYMSDVCKSLTMKGYILYIMIVVCAAFYSTKRIKNNNRENESITVWVITSHFFVHGSIVWSFTIVLCL